MEVSTSLIHIDDFMGLMFVLLALGSFLFLIQVITWVLITVAGYAAAKKLSGGALIGGIAGALVCLLLTLFGLIKRIVDPFIYPLIHPENQWMLAYPTLESTLYMAVIYLPIAFVGGFILGALGGFVGDLARRKFKMQSKDWFQISLVFILLGLLAPTFMFVWDSYALNSVQVYETGDPAYQYTFLDDADAQQAREMAEYEIPILTFYIVIGIIVLAGHLLLMRFRKKLMKWSLIYAVLYFLISAPNVLFIFL